jgi:hypothetical protein
MSPLPDPGQRAGSQYTGHQRGPAWNYWQGWYLGEMKSYGRLGLTLKYWQVLYIHWQLTWAPHSSPTPSTPQTSHSRVKSPKMPRGSAQPCSKYLWSGAFFLCWLVVFEYSCLPEFNFLWDSLVLSFLYFRTSITAQQPSNKCFGYEPCALKAGPLSFSFIFSLSKMVMEPIMSIVRPGPQNLAVKWVNALLDLMELVHHKGFRWKIAEEVNKESNSNSSECHKGKWQGSEDELMSEFIPVLLSYLCVYLSGNFK